jgi:hypothetical protein
MTSDPSKIFLDPGQAYTNVDRTLERITASRTDTVSSVDLFGDETGAAAFLRYGFGPALAKYLAEQSAAVTRRSFDVVLDGVRWEFLDAFDPVALGGPELANLHFGPLHVSRELMRDHFDPDLTPKNEYGVDDLSPADQSGVLLPQLMVHLLINAHCKSAWNH